MVPDHEQEIRERDYQTGLVGELEIFDKLKNNGYKVTPTPRYNPFDCKINDKFVGEIKKRNNAKNRYPTTLLPYSKLLEYKKIKKQYQDLIIIFKFTDGDYYTTYRTLCKNKVKYRPFTRCSGFKHQTKPYVYIPISLLKPLDQLVL